jgi:hypothetical protein
VTRGDFDDLADQIQDLDRARRELAQSLDASRIASVESEHWPRPLTRRRRIGGPLLLGAAVVVLALITRQWAVGPEVAPRGQSAVAAPVTAVGTTPAALTSPPLTSAEISTAASPPLVVQIKVVRSCSVRIVVDDVPLEWRTLQPGDEMISRPVREVVIETDDAGALIARVNGVETSLGLDGSRATNRFTR